LGIYSEHKYEIIDTNNMEILQELKENHNSLCYACDYSYDNKFIITSSFYDKLLNIW